jgi:pyrimidine-nucleoside phosphorylase
MIPQEIIRIKRDGGALTDSQIRWFFEGFLGGQIADYQVTAMLMAIYLRGMSMAEVAILTQVARDSGKVLSWPRGGGPVIDKHSTGGVGDKTSMIVLPLCLLEGVRVPMIAGRGLGHTGGTLDKLASIPGMNVFISAQQAATQMETLGGFFAGQTDEIAALDKRLYQLRDVTATIESNPLIVASILSKKLAEGLSGLVMDVKFGSGAFMQSLPLARNLAKDLIEVGAECGLKVRAVLSDMNSPLGNYAGNALEIFECIEIMKGRGEKELRDLTIELVAQMVHLAYPDQDILPVKTRLLSYLQTGACYEKFIEIVSCQGGDVRFLENTKNFFQAKIVRPVTIAGSEKYVDSVNVRELGLAILTLGGGRKVATDSVDPFVGLAELRHVGDSLAADEPVAIIHGNDSATVAQAESMIRAAYRRGSVKHAWSTVAETLS